MLRRALVALAFVGIGWAVATVQSQTPPRPDFELELFSKDGRTTIECVRGCGLQWVERMAPNPTEAKSSFSYTCFNHPLPNGCPSGRLGGWLTR